MVRMTEVYLNLLRPRCQMPDFPSRPIPGRIKIIVEGRNLASETIVILQANILVTSNSMRKSTNEKGGGSLSALVPRFWRDTALGAELEALSRRRKTVNLGRSRSSRGERGHRGQVASPLNPGLSRRAAS